VSAADPNVRRVTCGRFLRSGRTELRDPLQKDEKRPSHRSAAIGLLLINIGNSETGLRTTLPRAKYQDAVKRTAFYHHVLEGVRALPGVENAAYTSDPPFRTQGTTEGFRIEGRERAAGDPGDALLRVSSGDYLQTLGVRLKEGRLIQASDNDQAPRW
jgi:hypothetical protein